MLANLIVHPSGYNGNQSQQSLQWTHSQNAIAQSGAWEARHAILECITPDRLSQSAL